jgi:hypothetical protein
MTALPGFSANASLGSRSIARGNSRHRASAPGTVVPAMNCEATCFIKLVDCVIAHEMNCQSRHWWCKFWCRYGPPS